MTSCVRTIPEVWKVLEIVTDTVVVVFGAEDLMGILCVEQTEEHRVSTYNQSIENMNDRRCNIFHSRLVAQLKHLAKRWDVWLGSPKYSK